MRLFLLILLSVCYADVIHVPADYSTIQEGIDTGVAGDTVLVAEGTYSPSTNGEVFPIEMASE